MSTAEQQIKGSTEVDENGLQKYLIFRVGEQFYGAPLGDIIEVVEPFEVTSGPNSPKEFLGMINLRGEIISVVDLRVILGQEQIKHNKMLMIIVSTVKGKVAVLVDELIEVHDFKVEDLDLNPNLRTKISKDSLIGVAKYGSKVTYLIILPILLGFNKIQEVS
jgi:purine-binding chemotaxis protein CheW